MTKSPVRRVMDLKRCNLATFLVVPTFAARRLHSCKEAKDPSSENWNYFREGWPVIFAEDRFHAILGSASGSPNLSLYPLFNKNQAAWNFLSPELEVTWRTVDIIIGVVLVSPYLWIRGVSLSSIHYNQMRRVYINQKRQYSRLIWS